MGHGGEGLGAWREHVLGRAKRAQTVRRSLRGCGGGGKGDLKQGCPLARVGLWTGTCGDKTPGV